MIVIWYFLCGILGLALLVGVCFAVGYFYAYFFSYFLVACAAICFIIFIYEIGYFVYHLIDEKFIR